MTKTYARPLAMTALAILLAVGTTGCETMSDLDPTGLLSDDSPAPESQFPTDSNQQAAADAATITHHRRRMFVDAGRIDNRVLDVMAEHFQPWVTQQLQSGNYMGWLALDEAGEVVGGSGLMILDWAPHPLDPNSEHRGYLLNVYVDPAHRRKHIASHLIELALAEARRRRIRVVALHSTDAGRALYETNGFRATNEMFYVESVEG